MSRFLTSFNLRAYLMNRFPYRAALVGFADVEELVPNEYTELPHGISIGIRLSDQIVNNLISGPTPLYAYHYHVVNHYLNDLAIKVMNYLQRDGHAALPIPASLTIDFKQHRGHLSHKMVATRAGLGWIGKSALLVTNTFGPRVRFVTVLTDAPLRMGNPILESQCGDCRNCVKACPVGAIKGVNWSVKSNRADLLDVDRCAEFIEQNRAEVGAPVCGVCIQACPKGLKQS
ncbi:MAG: 4Fe-4S double cluster binding domain-containing protein [Promethearchaeota archaeon]